jgi:hypothetical protein
MKEHKRKEREKKGKNKEEVAFGGGDEMTGR